MYHLYLYPLADSLVPEFDYVTSFPTKEDALRFAEDTISALAELGVDMIAEISAELLSSNF